MQLIKQRIHKNALVEAAVLLSGNPKASNSSFTVPARRVMNATSGSEHKSCSLPQMQF